MLDIGTGEIRWFSKLIDDEDDAGFTFKTHDGRYVFFEGPDGSEAPIGGFNVSTGGVRKLLKENVSHATFGSMSEVWWVESPETTHHRDP